MNRVFSGAGLLDPEAIRHDLRCATEVLQRPAGPDPRFATLDSMHAHRDDFIGAVHGGWKFLHAESIRVIAQADRLESSGSSTVLEVIPVDYLRQLWRRVNDAIVWSILRERHLVKRLCLYRERGPLREAHPQHALEVIEELNRSPHVIALWNDATYVVDVGDVMQRDMQSGTTRFLELKDGVVNTEILSILAAESAGHVATSEMLEAFRARRGRSGAKQLDRVRRQKQRDDQVMSLIHNDRGVDPVTSEEIEVVDSGIEEESYDSELRDVVLRAASEGQALACVDECLWLYVDRQLPGDKASIWRRMAERIARVSSIAGERFIKAQALTDFSGIAHVTQGLRQHIALPIFLRDLAASEIVDMVFGPLVGRVIVFLDMEALGERVVDAGGAFAWSSAREGRRGRARPWEVQALTVGERIPLVQAGDTRFEVTTPSVVRVMFDGLRPASLAKILVATAHGRGGQGTEKS